MKEFFIHIHNEKCFMDSDVSVKVKHQIIPRKGDYFYLSEEQNAELVRKVLYSDKFESYEVGYFTNNVDKEDLFKMPLNQIIKHFFSFENAVIVKDVAFTPNGEIHIELYDGWIKNA